MTCARENLQQQFNNGAAALEARLGVIKSAYYLVVNPNARLEDKKGIIAELCGDFYTDCADAVSIVRKYNNNNNNNNVKFI